MAEMINSIGVDATKAFQLLAMMIKGASLDQERLVNLASKFLDSDRFSCSSTSINSRCNCFPSGLDCILIYQWSCVLHMSTFPPS